MKKQLTYVLKLNKIMMLSHLQRKFQSGEKKGIQKIYIEGIMGTFS